MKIEITDREKKAIREILSYMAEEDLDAITCVNEYFGTDYEDVDNISQEELEECSHIYAELRVLQSLYTRASL